VNSKEGYVALVLLTVSWKFQPSEWKGSGQLPFSALDSATHRVLASKTGMRTSPQEAFSRPEPRSASCQFSTSSAAASEAKQKTKPPSPEGVGDPNGPS
jgi:beta-glucanase (GH16 family)